MTDDLEAIKEAIARGGADSAQRLLPIVYEQLKRLARSQIRREAPGHSLQATGLVHEAYLRLVGPGGEGEVVWQDDGHFLAAAANAMRRILIDRARARGARKRGGDRVLLRLADISTLGIDAVVAPELLDLDDALTRLAQTAPEKAELVSLRFFAGLTGKEAAAVLGISEATAERHWVFARAWLLAAMRSDA